MDNAEITNFLLMCLATAWAAKIWFHFEYLKATNEALKDSNIVSFFINPENLFKIIRVVMPMFWTRQQENGVKEKKRAWRCTLVLWLMFGVSFFYLYNFPVKEEVQQIRYDLTK